MIESIYSKENGKQKDRNKANVMFRMPKNIRQMGKTDGNKKIYVEDYVMTYVKQLVKSETGAEKMAILLGQFVKTENSKNIFINGAIEVEHVHLNEISAFSNEIWTSIYDNIKKYFNDVEIVGWYYSKPGMGLELNEQLSKVHVANFAGQGKTLLIYDSLEDEEVFYIYDNNKLTRLEGYYVYYDRNEDMQTYMVESNENKSEEQDYDDRAIKEIRTIIAEKNEEKTNDHVKVVHVLYGASTLMALTVLIIGATLLNNNDKMSNMQDTLNVISQNVFPENKTDSSEGEGKSDSGGKTGINSDNNTTGTNVTEVETIKGDLDSEKDNTENEKEGSIKDEVKNIADDEVKQDEVEQDEIKQDEVVQENKSSTTIDSNTETTTDEGKETMSNNNEGSASQSGNDKNTNNEENTTDSNTNTENKESEKEEIKETQKDTEKETDNSKNTNSEKKSETSDTTKNDVTTKKSTAEKESSTNAVKETASNKTNYYIVKEGDTLVSISASIYNSTKYVQKLCEVNKIDDQDKILVGQKLIIP